MEEFILLLVVGGMVTIGSLLGGYLGKRKPKKIKVENEITSIDLSDKQKDRLKYLVEKSKTNEGLLGEEFDELSKLSEHDRLNYLLEKDKLEEGLTQDEYDELKELSH